MSSVKYYDTLALANATNRITEGETIGDEAQHDAPTENINHAITTDDATSAQAPPSEHKDRPPAPVEQRSGVDGRPIRQNRPAVPLPTAYQNDYTRKPNRSTSRVTSPGGGVQVTLDGSGSWSELARQDATLPSDANVAAEGKEGGSSSSMFGFLKSKKGRTSSPRPKERGVLGKEGARVVIG